MKTPATAPTGNAQVFAVNETFFSTTDAKGVITAGNEIFARTSGYARPELVGQPHNLIRHPDMPRLVFRLLWQSCRAGRPFVGYVKNLAKNGNHYWVFAVVVPIPSGFLSIRFKPTSPLLGRVEAMYARMLAAENAALAAGQSEGRAADAAAPVSAAELQEAGFASYEAFSHHALNTEIKCRDAEIASRQLTLFPDRIGQSGGGKLQDFYRQSLQTYGSINELFALLDAFIALSEQIRSRKDRVQIIAQEFRLNAFNASIAAHALGSLGEALSMVAQNLSAHGESLSRHIGTLAGAIVGTTAAVADLASNLSAARLQLEMLLSFTAEISSSRTAHTDAAQTLALIGDLRAALTHTLQHASRAIEQLQAQLPAVMTSKEDLHRDIIYLQVAQTTGLTEVVRLARADGLTATFGDLRAQIEAGKQELDQLDAIIEKLAALTNESPVKVAAILQAIASMAALGAIELANGSGSDAVPAAESDQPASATAPSGAPNAAFAPAEPAGQRGSAAD